MEKRTIIAFVLSFLVLLIWSFLFAPKQEQVPSKKTDIPAKKEQAVSESTKSPIPQKAVIQPKAIQKEDRVTPQIDEKEISIETPLYSAVITNIGAAIKSFRLKKYHLNTESDSPIIELVNLKEGREDFLRINFYNQSRVSNEKIIYHINEESLKLGHNSPPRDLIFSSGTSDGISIIQTFRFYPDRYNIDLIITLMNNSEKQVEGSLQARLKNLPPQEKKSYYSFTGFALLLNGGLEEIEVKDLEKDKNYSGRIGWVAYEDDFFISSVIFEDTEEGGFKGRLLKEGVIDATYTSMPISLKNLEQHTSRFSLYLGPRDLGILKQLGKDLDLAINFGWTDIIAKPLLHTLRFCNKYLNNYGISIIILTVLIKILFWPLTQKSYKSMKAMQKLQPLMAKIREKHKNNKEQMNKELMALYKTYKVNPMGGCLPMIIQIPVFFALFRTLGNSIELRHAPFLLWINDLSAPDRLFNFPFQIPFMSPPYGIPVLTLLMGASMYIQQKMTPTVGDPTQAKIMMFLPIIFTGMFINFPSGLVLYWLVNNILSIGQQYGIKRRPD
ncbi:MAG: membrane protein insertase YidC [Pseudomonadota bacterium]